MKNCHLCGEAGVVEVQNLGACSAHVERVMAIAMNTVTVVLRELRALVIDPGRD